LVDSIGVVLAEGQHCGQIVVLKWEDVGEVNRLRPHGHAWSESDETVHTIDSYWMWSGAGLHCPEILIGCEHLILRTHFEVVRGVENIASTPSARVPAELVETDADHAADGDRRLGEIVPVDVEGRMPE
jgi:hypothetical protein